MLKSLPGRLLLGLVVLAMVYRGAIPVGYMLAPSPAAAGQITVTLCVAGGGTISVPMDAAFANGDSSPDDPAGAECPFTVMAAQFVLPEPPALAPVRIAAGPPAPFAAYKPGPALPPLGPPLGPRAPPSLLA